MAVDKVNWQLIDGLRSRLDLLNMLESVIKKLIDQREIEYYRGQGREKSKGWDYDRILFRIPGNEMKILIKLSHQRGAIGFIFEDKGNRYRMFGPDNEWKHFKLVKEFNLNTEHFFPLDANEQEEKLKKFIKDSIDEFKHKVKYARK